VTDRLRDRDSSPEPDVAQAAKILRFARPLEPSRERKNRVRARLSEPGAAMVSLRRLRLRAATVVAVLLVSTGALAATLWVVIRPSRSVAPPPEKVRPAPRRETPIVPRQSPTAPRASTNAPPAKSSVPRKARAAVRPRSSILRPARARTVAKAEVPPASEPSLAERTEAPASREEAPPPPPSPEVLTPRAEPATPPETAAPAPTTPKPETSAAPPAPKPKPETPAAPPAPKPKPETIVPPAVPPEEARLVLRAMKSLRRDRNPRAAAKQLDQYLAKFPRGVLLEEALGLAIEAAVLRGDDRASDLARRYLTRFPSGRFRSAAESALQPPQH
jgi:hypothetical protein